MEILKDVSVLWSLIHTLVLFLFLFESRYPKKKTIILTLVTMVPLGLVNFVLYVLLGFERYGMVMLLTMSLPSCVVFHFLARHRDGRFFFTFCMVDTVVLEILYITNILNHYLTPDSALLMFTVRLLAFPLLELWVYKKLRPMYLTVQRRQEKGWGLFALIGALFYVAITLLMVYPSPIVERPAYIPALSLLFLLMPVIYAQLILTLRNQQRFYEMAEQESIMRLQVANVTSRIREINEVNERFREERHDFRHKMKAIASLAAAGQYEELMTVIGEYGEDVRQTRIERYSQSPIVDAVLSAYIKKAENAGISVKLGFAFPDTFAASESELATALANALENAVNACAKLPQEKRFLEIKVLCRPKFIVMVRNSFDGKVTFSEEGIPQNPNEEHGFGTRSIAAFCKKIGGYYEFQAADGVFTLFMHLK